MYVDYGRQAQQCGRGQRLPQTVTVSRITPPSHDKDDAKQWAHTVLHLGIGGGQAWHSGLLSSKAMHFTTARPSWGCPG